MTWANCPRCFRFHDLEGRCLDEEGSLFAPKPLVRIGAPRTHYTAPASSVKAAAVLEPKVGSWRARVLEAFRDAGEAGLTQEELVDSFGEDASGVSFSTIRSRVSELRKAGWVEDSGENRPQRNGASAV